MENENYSVLMSVYIKEKASFLRESLQSIYDQSVPSNDVVLVCDGPLTQELDQVIEEMQERFGEVLQVVRLEKNMGLGNALNEGLKVCKNDLVARMDSDDVSLPERCRRQLRQFQARPELSVVSGTILEFRDTIENQVGKRVLPGTDEEIRRFSRKRNPFNHPAVMFRKKDVEKVGGYREKFHLFEDYDLWIRMLQMGMKGGNIREPILCMRAPEDIYARRGGLRYTVDMLRFHLWLKKSGWTSIGDLLTGALPHAAVCIMPNRLRKIVYSKLHV